MAICEKVTVVERQTVKPYTSSERVVVSKGLTRAERNLTHLARYVKRETNRDTIRVDVNGIKSRAMIGKLKNQEI